MRLPLASAWPMLGSILLFLASLLFNETDVWSAPAPVTTLQSAAAATANGLTLNVADKGVTGVSITGTFVGTITFEASTDGATTWSVVSCTNISSLLAVTEATTTGQFICTTAGLTGFRARISAYTSGTITVTAFPTNVGGSSMGGSAGTGPGGTTLGAIANEVAPTKTEGETTPLSTDLLNGLRIIMQTLLWCEDETNHLCMTSGGAVRVFPILTAVTTNATSATAIVHSGGKTPMASLTAASGAITGTVTFYGDFENTTTNGEPICALVLDGTTKNVKYCNQFTRDYPYYHAVVSNISASTTVEASIAVGAVGSRTDKWQLSGVKTADALIKTGYGELQCVVFSANDATPVSGTIAINDAVSAGTGTALLPTQFFSTSPFVAYELCFPNTSFTTGLYFDFTTTTDVSVAASYR